MNGATREIVTVEAGDLSLGCAVALYGLFEKLARQYGISDVYEVECSLVMSASNLTAPNEADAQGLKQALDDLRIDAQLTEVKL